MSSTGYQLFGDRFTFFSTLPSLLCIKEPLRFKKEEEKNGRKEGKISLTEIKYIKIDNVNLK